MQNIAFDPQENRPVSAFEAKKQAHYLCLECGKHLRLRGGVHRQLHFFHLDPHPSCRQYGKSFLHLKIQEYLCKAIPSNEAKMEVRFPAIRRVADVVWEKRKIIFEIQCSTISSIEVENRIRDYYAIGYDVVWVLHDKLFNKPLLTLCEILLQAHTHFYTNFSIQGQGVIYDQYTIDRKYIRLAKTAPQPIAITSPCSPKSVLLSTKQLPSHFIKFVKKRRVSWKISFEGDLLHHTPSEEELHQWDIHFPYFWSKQGIFKRLDQWILKPYTTFFHLLLEKNLH